MTQAMETRIFSVADANRALELVASITEDVVQKWRELDSASRSEEGEEETRRLTRELQGFVRELSQVGCTLRDVERGVVDFPAVLDGEEVALSWKLGEAEVSHWYEREGAFDGRRPVGAREREGFLEAA